MTDSILALPHGTELNHYTIEEVLGQGGFGVVYKAHHTHLKEKVVIKEFLPVELAGRSKMTVTPHASSKQSIYDDCLSRFMEEGRTLVKLRHENIVRCRDLFTANQTAYLVMDFEDGLPLDSLVKELESQGQRYSEKQLLHFLLPLIDGLAYIHEQDVLHRDIKPDNVFIRRSNGSPVIIDFGAAKQNFAVVSKSQAPYTEFYAPMEQLEGGGEAKPTIDIHAFGGLMYRLVTGQAGPKAEARALAIVRGKADPLQKAEDLVAEHYSKTFLKVIDRCLAFDDADRPQSMHEVKTLLLSGVDETEVTPETQQADLQQLDELLLLAGADKIINESEMTMLLNKASQLGIDNLSAQQYIIQYALANDWQLSNQSNAQSSSSQPDDSAEEVKPPPVKESHHKTEGHSSEQSKAEQQNNRPDNSDKGETTHDNEVSKKSKPLAWIAAVIVIGVGSTYGWQYFKSLEEIKSEQVTTQKAQTTRQNADAAYYIRSDYDKAFDLYRSASEEGNLIATAQLARMYFKGYGTKKDTKKAKFMMSEIQGEINRAVDRGDAEAMYFKADLKVAFDKRTTETNRLYHQSAERGFALAQNQLGYKYQTGTGVTQDDNKAFMWFEKSAAQGYVTAESNLGYMYQNGKGVTKNLSEAVKWYRKSSEQGNARGQANLGYMYETGKGITKNLSEAVKWYRKSAEQGYARGQTNLGIMYQNAKGVNRDYKEAINWYKKAAEQGYARGQSNLATMYRNGNGVTTDYKEALKWYRKAADQGYANGQANLGYMYGTAKGVPKDYKAAIKWYKKAAEQGVTSSQYNVGLYYEYGRGVKISQSIANDWYTKAARNGYKKAQDKLKSRGKTW